MGDFVGAQKVQYEKRMRVVTVGEAGCGKTSFITRMVLEKFNQHTESTIGAAFYRKDLPAFNTTLEFWDTAGAERYRSLAPMYYRGADIIFVAYDLTRSVTDSAKEINYWRGELEDKGPESAAFALIGLKCELLSERGEDIVAKQAAVEEALKPFNRPCPSYAVSAATGEGVDELLHCTLTRMLGTPLQSDRTGAVRLPEMEETVPSLKTVKLGKARRAQNGSKVQCPCR